MGAPKNQQSAPNGNVTPLMKPQLAKGVYTIYGYQSNKLGNMPLRGIALHWELGTQEYVHNYLPAVRQLYQEHVFPLYR